MKRWLLGISLGALLIGGAFAAAPVIYPTGLVLQSPPNGIVDMLGNGPRSTGVLATSGVLTLTGATPVTVAQTAVTATSMIIVTLKTVGGTVGALPVVQTITAGTGFTIQGTAADTSVYNYLILG